MLVEQGHVVPQRHRFGGWHRFNVVVWFCLCVRPQVPNLCNVVVNDRTFLGVAPLCLAGAYHIPLQCFQLIIHTGILSTGEPLSPRVVNVGVVWTIVFTATIVWSGRKWWCDGMIEMRHGAVWWRWMIAHQRWDTALLEQMAAR